jgi:S-adenosylmethionine:diacylglycerol 3-amino-3-carboxypropyl transferase
VTTLASPIAQAHAWEDPATTTAVVERVARAAGRPLRVLAIASGGDAVLALLGLAQIGRLDAVDANRAQLRLVALRLAALLQLSTDEQLALFGSRPGGDPHERLRLYRRLQAQLEPAVRAYWDEHLPEIGKGLDRLGRFEGLYARLAEGFAAHGLDPVRRPAEALTHKAWPSIFSATFEPERVQAALGPAAVAFAPEPLAERLAAAFADGMLEFNPHANHHLYLALTGYMPEAEAALPAYFRAKGAIAELGPKRLRLHEGRLGAQLNILTATGPFDVIDTGCETDFMPLEGVRHLFQRAAEALAPGGAIVARRFNGAYDLHAELGAALEVDRAMTDELAAKDRSILYRELAIAFKP